MRTGNKSLNSVCLSDRDWDGRWLSDTQVTLLRCDWSALTAAGTPCRPPTPPSSVTGGWNRAALCQGWPNPSGSYTAPPGRRWNPETEVRGQTEAKRPTCWMLPPESRAHLELVFDDLSLFVLQLQEEELVLLQTSKEDSPLQTRNVLPRTGSWCSGETTIVQVLKLFRGAEQGSDLCAGLEDGHVLLRQVFCDSEPAATERSKLEVRGQPAGQRSARWFEAFLKKEKVYLLLYEMICCSISSLYKLSALFCVTVTSWISSDLKMLINKGSLFQWPFRLKHPIKTKRSVKDQVSQLLGSIPSERWTVGMAT